MSAIAGGLRIRQHVSREHVSREHVSRQTSWGEDLVASLLGLWSVIGLYLDGWAHNTRSELESVLTPWHGVLYSGAAAGSLWLGFAIVRRHTGDRSWRESVPPGCGLAVVGAVCFGAAGVADLTWHTIFGVEANIEALLSPSHLLLFVGGLLMLSTPLRTAWLVHGDRPHPRGAASLLPALMSLMLTTAAVAFFFQYVTHLSQEFPLVAGATLGTEPERAFGMASIFIANVILIGPLVLLIRRFGPPPRGTATFLFTALTALLAFVTTGLKFPEAIPAAFASGLVVDALFVLLRPSGESPRRLWLAAALAPVALWSGYFVSVELAVGIAWPPEYWTGAPLMAGLMGFAMAFLAAPEPTRAVADRSTVTPLEPAGR